jgi:hypothetical protein
MTMGDASIDVKTKTVVVDFDLLIVAVQSAKASRRQETGRSCF